jgi:hypothetical protein
VFFQLSSAGTACSGQKRGMHMNLSKIDLSSLPDLDTLTGVFGSLHHATKIAESDDSILVLMTWLYEILMPF